MDQEISTPALAALINLLLAASGLTALVSTRIAPPGGVEKTEPYVTVANAGDRPSHGLTYSEPDSVLFRAVITGWAASYTACSALMDQIEKATEGESITITNWGTCRIEGVGSGPRDYIENDVVHFYGSRNVKYLLVNQSTS